MTTSNITLTTDTITLSDPGYAIDLSSMSGTYYGIAGSNSTYPYTLNTGATSWASSSTLNVGQSGKVDIRGEDADILVNGESLMATLREIKEELRIPGLLERKPELEQDFDELRALAEEYQAKVVEYKEKKRAWDILKRN